jgi:dCMP deaminase
MKKKFIDYFMNIADLTSKLSYAKRLQVGAVIVKGNQIIGTGYNGMPTGWENNCEDKQYMDIDAGGWLDPNEIEERWPYQEMHEIVSEDGCVDIPVRYRLKTKPEVLHAESNAIAKVSRSTESSEGATLFCTHAPCIECAKLIYQSGINSVYYREQYRDNSGLDFLRQGGVNVHQYSDSV